MSSKINVVWSYSYFEMFLKVLQEARHGWVTFKVIEVVVDPQQHYSSDL